MCLSRPIQSWRTKLPPLLLATVTISGNIGTNCPKPRTGDDGRELSYTPCLLLKPAPYFRLALPQIQPCFPAASNALARPRQPHFRTNADRAYNTLHFASKVVCQKGLCPLWIPPQEKAIRTPSPGTHIAFSCCWQPVSQSAPLCPCP